MFQPIAFPIKAHSALLDRLAADQWPAVLEAIENDYPIGVRNERGQSLFASFVERAGPASDPLSMAWQSSIVEALLHRGS